MRPHDSRSALESALAAFEQALTEAELSAGDTPEAEDRLAVVDAIRDAAVAIRTELQAATATLANARGRRTFGRAVAACHEQYNELARRVRSELAATPTIVELASIAAERGEAWPKWSLAVQEALERCAAASDAVATALLDCWRELVEHTPTPRLEGDAHA